MIDKIFIGWDSRFQEPADVLKYSIEKHAKFPLPPIEFLKLNELEKLGFHNPHDPLASTEFTYSRFLVPWLMDYKGIALFMDNDMLCLRDISYLNIYKPTKYWALKVVKHDYRPTNKTKMYGCKQTRYKRKNWSSFMLMNCERLKLWTKERVEEGKGKFLHQFTRIPNSEIDSLDSSFNELEYKDNLTHILHYTNGGPWFDKCKRIPYADLWFEYRNEYLKSLDKK